MDNNNNKAEDLILEDTLKIKIDELFQLRHSSNFIDQVESLGALDLKRKLLNTIKLIDNINIPNVVEKTCNKPVLPFLQIETDKTVLDLLFDNKHENVILNVLKNTEKEDRKYIWPIAIKNKAKSIVKWLIDNDLAQINTPNINGYTPGAFAVVHGQKDIAYMLKMAGAHFGYVTNQEGHTLWHLAVLNKDIKLINDCIELEVPINVADRKGYTAAYYMILEGSSQLEKARNKLFDIDDALKADLFNAVMQSDSKALGKILETGISVSCKNALGYTLLDVALVLNNAEVIQVLQLYKANICLYEQKLIKLNNSCVDLFYNSGQSYSIEINKIKEVVCISLNQTDSSGNLLSRLDISPWTDTQQGKMNGSWKTFTKESICYIVLSKNDASTQPDIFCEVSNNGELKLQYVNLPSASLQLSTYNEVTFDSIAAIKKLAIKAESIKFGGNSKSFNGQTLKLEANSVAFEGAHNFKESEIIAQVVFRHRGDLVSEVLNLKAESAIIYGQLMITHKTVIELMHQLDFDGNLVIGKWGKITAHVIQISKNGHILVQQGNLNMYGAAKLENSGSIIGDTLALSSGMILTNNYGALIKGQSCSLTAPQTNQGGFYISGQKTTLSYVDWGLNFMRAGIKVAEVGAYISNPTALTLRAYLLVVKTAYRAGQIAYKAMNSEEINSSELVTLILDNVIPCFGAISCHEEQAKVLVNILYHCYGHYHSEELFVEKSLLAIEAISRAVRQSSFGMLSEENLLFLHTATEYIRYSRIGLKIAKISVETIRGVASNDISALEKVQSSVSAMAEIALREYAYTMEPVELFNTNVHLPARDLAIFVLNKGYNSDLFLQAVVFGSLQAARQEGLINADTDIQLNTAIRSLLKSKQWHSLYLAYQEGRLTKHAVANEAINSVLFILSNPIISDAITSAKISIEESNPEVNAKIEPSDNPASESEKQSENDPFSILKSHERELSELDERFKLATTEEEREATSKLIAEQHIHFNEQAKQVIPEREIQNINIDANKFIEPALAKKTAPPPQDTPITNKLYSALIEVQKAFNGEYAGHGYLAVFADAFHNDELMSVNGNMGVYSGNSGTNSGQMLASNSIGLFGQDVNNRKEDETLLSEKLAQLSHTQFTNFEKGLISAQEALSLYCIGLIENIGALDSHQDITVIASRIVKNHKQGKIIAKKDVTLLCDSLADNKGTISGANVKIEGSKNGAINSGQIYGLDKIRLISEKLASNKTDGLLVGSEVSFEATDIQKEGAINAVLVQAEGYNQAEASSVVWKRNDRDEICVLKLKPKATDAIDADAFSKVALLDVTFSNSFEKAFSFHVSEDFTNILQFHLPEDDKPIPVFSLPKLSSKATFILDAPGHALDAAGAKINYDSQFRFTGKALDYSLGKVTFSQSVAFATDKIIGLGGASELYLQKGSFVQSEGLLNQGYIHSDGVIQWNLGCLDNDAQLETYSQYFFENKAEKDKGIKREYCATRVFENSGTIFALGHQGHLGIFNQNGGLFKSGVEGTFVYHSGGHQKAILVHEGRQTADIVEDGGQSWHVMPIWRNAEISSAGHNVIIGLEKLYAAGLTFYGNKEAFLYAAKGVDFYVQNAAYHISATESKTKKGKLKKYVQQEVNGFVHSQNHVSSKEGEASILALEGDVLLENSVILAEINVNILAKNKVVIDGVESSAELKDKKRKSHGLFNHQSVKSNTKENIVYCSYIFSNGSLTICCEELTFKAVKGSIAGDLNILAKKATLNGKKQTFDNVSKTKEFRFSMPGLDNLNSIIKGENAKVIFNNLIRTAGWNDQELHNILHAKSIAELPLSVANFARDTINLTSFVAHACKELGESPSAFAGAITDKMGLTTMVDGNRVVNPHFSFKFTKTTEHTKASQNVPTTFKVGGTFRMIGDALYLLDGAEVDAEHLRIFLVDGIKATYGTDASVYSKNAKSIGLGVNALNPQDVEVSLALSKAYQSDEIHHLSKLVARNSIVVEAGNQIKGAVIIQGDAGGMVRANKMEFESVQDKHVIKTLDVGVHASSMGSSAGVNFQQGKQEIYQTPERAGINLKNAKVCANHLVLQNGSKVEADLLQREDGQEGLPTVTGTDVVDSRKQKSKGFSLESQPMQGVSDNTSVGFNASSENEETLLRASVIVSNVSEGALPGINTEASKEIEMIKDKKKVVAFALPSLQEANKQLNDLKKAGSKVLNVTSKLATNVSKIQLNSKKSQEPLKNSKTYLPSTGKKPKIKSTVAGNDTPQSDITPVGFDYIKLKKKTN